MKTRYQLWDGILVPRRSNFISPALLGAVAGARRRSVATGPAFVAEHSRFAEFTNGATTTVTLAGTTVSGDVINFACIAY